MNCETCTNKMLSLDRGERLPLSAAFHLAHCDECLTTWRVMNGVYGELEKVVDSSEIDVCDAVMDSLPEDSRAKQGAGGVSLGVWILVGLGLVAVMFFTVLADFFVQARNSLGDVFLMPVSLVFGIGLSIYLVFFIVSHMSYLERLSQAAGALKR
ncbi:MAG: hypothetical protein JW760_00380 [Spirochaetales bacterium]|nr:hypothetical protein [Spirochaetales bacterium]